VTKERLPLTAERALTQIAGVIGWECVADIAGKSERQVRRWGDNDVPTSITLKTAAELDIAYHTAGGGGFPLTECLQLRVETGASAAAPDLAAQAELAADAAEEVGEAIAAQIRAMAPGAGRKERLVAAKETEEAISHLKATLPFLDPANEAQS
jgi:hypothetical protein